MATAGTRANRFSRVWYLNGVLALVLVAVVPLVVDWPTLQDDLRLTWPVVAIIYAIAEAAVLHFRFRRDAHSFSMGEIALTVSLLAAAPFDLIIGQAVGNAIAFIGNRRQTPVKAAFNVAQFTLQAVAALAVHRWVLGSSDPLGERGWLALVLASLAALIVSDVSVNSAIRLSGGSVPPSERWTIRVFSGLAALMNTALGIIIVLVWSLNSAALVLAIVPPIMLFLAYRAYVGQRADRSRVIELQTAAEGLLRAETLGDVARVAAQRVQEMFEVERAVAVIYPLGGSHALRGEAHADGATSVETLAQAQPLELGSSPRVLTGSDLRLVGETGGQTQLGLYGPIIRGSEQVGYLLAVQPLSDVFRFGDADLRLVSAFAGQVATIVENERLGGAVSVLSGLVESKNEVLAAVGHEIRSPLAAMVSAATTLETRAADLSADQRAELIHLIRRNGLELSAVADDLMVAARNEDAMTPDIQLVDPAVEVRNVLTALVESAGDIEVRGDACPIWADPTRFRQIIRNLLVNAERYGGDHVWIEFDIQPDTLRVAVVDDGPGVSADQAEAIFEPYATAHRDRNRPQALGLGLAISRRLARSMSGDVLYSRDGELTRFTAVLPRPPSGMAV